MPRRAVYREPPNLRVLDAALGTGMDRLNLRWTGGLGTGGVEAVAVEVEDGVDGVEVFQSDEAGGSETWKGLCYGDDELGDHFTAWVAAFSEFKVRIF